MFRVVRPKTIGHLWKKNYQPKKKKRKDKGEEKKTKKEKKETKRGGGNRKFLFLLVFSGGIDYLNKRSKNVGNKKSQRVKLFICGIYISRETFEGKLSAIVTFDEVLPSF